MTNTEAYIISRWDMTARLAKALLSMGVLCEISKRLAVHMKREDCGLFALADTGSLILR